MKLTGKIIFCKWSRPNFSIRITWVYPTVPTAIVWNNGIWVAEWSREEGKPSTIIFLLWGRIGWPFQDLCIEIRRQTSDRYASMLAMTILCCGSSSRRSRSTCSATLTKRTSTSSPPPLLSTKSAYCLQRHIVVPTTLNTGHALKISY